MGRCFLLAALAGGLVACSSEPISTEPTRPANLALEERDGLFFKPGATTPFTGTLARQHVNGAPSHEAVYTNGLRLLQRSWYTNGVPRTEYRFQDGHMVVRRDWNFKGQLQTWKNLEVLAHEQFLRGVNYFTNQPPDWHQAYVWFHIASANGHRNARQALRTPPENFSPEALSHARNEAMGLLGRTNEVTTPDPPQAPKPVPKTGETEKN